MLVFVFERKEVPIKSYIYKTIKKIEKHKNDTLEYGRNFTRARLLTRVKRIF